MQANLVGAEIDLRPLDRSQIAAPPTNVVSGYEQGPDYHGNPFLTAT